jgi:hypothetical protein
MNLVRITHGSGPRCRRQVVGRELGAQWGASPGESTGEISPVDAPERHVYAYPTKKAVIAIRAPAVGYSHTEIRAPDAGHSC